MEMLSFKTGTFARRHRDGGRAAADGDLENPERPAADRKTEGSRASHRRNEKQNPRTEATRSRSAKEKRRPFSTREKVLLKTWFCSCFGFGSEKKAIPVRVRNPVQVLLLNNF